MQETVCKIEYNCMIPQEKRYTVKGESDLCCVLIIKSVCDILCQNARYSVFPDSVLCLPRETDVTVISGEDPVYFDGFHFCNDEMYTDAEMIDGLACGELSSLIKQMKTECFEDRMLRDDICLTYSRIFFMKLARLKFEKETRRKVHAFYSIRENIYNQPYINWKIEDIVAASGLSRRQFYYTWHAVFKNTPLQDILNSRIEYAKTLLTTTEMRIGEISSACNFSSDQYFIQTFKKRVGVSPSKFRFDFVRFTDIEQRT